jgi:ferredoxin--NADP+ reductase
MDACPFDCIHPSKDERPMQPLYFIDPETCTDCGACALVCPESAIAPAAAFGRYAGPAAGAKANSYDSHLEVAPPDAEPGAFEVIAKEWLTTFVASQP